MSSRLERMVGFLDAQRDRVLATSTYARVERAVGMLLETSLIDAPIGAICMLENAQLRIPCEIVGFSDDRCFLMALAPTTGVQSGSWIEVPAESSTNGDLAQLPCLDSLLGRVISGLAQPLDNGLPFVEFESANRLELINPMARPPISEPLDTGVGVLNGLLTMGVGQRVGLFAGSGVGKSVFLGMLARHVAADVVVVGLIGERGREVAEFVHDVLDDSMARSVVVASPADDSPALRLRAGRLASQLAELYARQGKRVLLLMDSFTRIAQAQREIGLALGEPAATKGYTPSSFAWLPKLAERAGTFSGGGSVTGFYTVLMEEDDLQDPVVDTARAILDGHVVLSRQLAEQGIYPAVDVSASISRLMNKLVPADHQDQARQFRQLWHTYTEQQDLINVGAYRPGTDPLIDRAITTYPNLCAYLRQPLDECVPLTDARSRLDDALAPGLASLTSAEPQDFPMIANSGG